jgi:hypothetical protein
VGGALKSHAAARARAEEEELAALRSSPLSRLASGESDLSFKGRGELVAAGGQMKRAGRAAGRRLDL